MIFLPFHPDHLLGMGLVPQEESYMERMKEGAIRRQWYYPALSFSAMDGGKIYATFGILPLWAGRGLAWSLFDKEINPRRFVVTALRSKEMMEATMEHCFYRLEAYIRADYPNAHRYAKLLGFECEGLMRNFDGENDFHLYARTK